MTLSWCRAVQVRHYRRPSGHQTLGEGELIIFTTDQTIGGTRGGAGRPQSADYEILACSVMPIKNPTSTNDSRHWLDDREITEETQVNKKRKRF